MGFCFVSEDVFSEPIPARIGRTNARRNETQTPTYQNANRWSLGCGIQRTIDLYFVCCVLSPLFLEPFPRSSAATPSGKDIYEKITKIQQHPLHKYDGYDILEFLFRQFPHRRLQMVISLLVKRYVIRYLYWLCAIRCTMVCVV